VLYITGNISPTIAGLRITGGNANGLGGYQDGGGIIDSGGGVYIITSTVTIRDSDVFGNTALVGGGFFSKDSDSLLSENAFTANSATHGGGLVLQNSDTALRGNVIVSNTANWAGGGLYAENGSVKFSGNKISDNEASQGGGLFLGFSDARLTSDLIADNRANIAGSGLYIVGSSSGLLHTTIARNTGGTGSGVQVIESAYGDPSTVGLTNTILISHSVGISVTSGNTVTVNGILWHNTPITISHGVTAFISTQNQYHGSPAFALDGYHITPASAAIDAGIDAGVTADIDGHDRPYGDAPDLGADEIIATSVTTATPATLVYTDTNGSPTIIRVPAEAVTETIMLTFSPQETVTAPSGLVFAGHAFDLEVFRDGTLLPGFAFDQPVSVTIHYTHGDVVWLDEDTLELHYWDGSAWVDAATTCTPASLYVRRPSENWFAVSICRVGSVAAFGVPNGYRAYLPIVMFQVTDGPEPPPPPPLPAPPAGFALWRAADGGFSDWERVGVALGADGELQLDLSTALTGTDPYPPGGYYGHNFYNGAGFWVGVVDSPIMTAPFSFKEGVASWNADTPAGTWMETLVRAQLGDRWTKWYNMGVWAADTSTVERHSVRLQEDADAYVDVDTLMVTNDAEPVTAYQLRLRLFSDDDGAIPSVRNASFAFSETLDLPGTLPSGNPDLWDRVLPVPECSQMVYPDGGTVWCSPTSTAMVLKYWMQDDGPCEPGVRAAVAGVYDWLYDGHGNWPFNTAYAATHGLEGYVARLTSLAQAEEWIAADVPLIFRLAWEAGELTGAPLLWSYGHLMVLVGFDADGDPVLNDPAAPSDESVQRTYIREEFESLWLEHTNGTAYLIYPPGWPVPDL
jgi:hypothetical protein